MARILVLDDHPDILETLVCLLEASGHDVTAASNGKEGLEAGPETFDAILLDLRMPIVDGWTFKQELNQRAVDVPVIIISGEPNLTAVAEELGAVACVSKPDIERVSLVLENALCSNAERSGTGTPKAS